MSTYTSFTKICKIPVENSSNFWNSLSSAASSGPIRNSINNYRVQPWVHLSPCYCKYLHGTLWILSHSLISNINQVVVQYVDDVHSATRKDQVNKLQEHLNSIDPHIKFTIELSRTDGVSFLDTLTKPTPNSIESTVYRKPTHTDRYLDYNTNHPISAKLSVIHTLIHRAKQVCSTPNIFAKEMDHLHKVLQDNQYPEQFYQ